MTAPDHEISEWITDLAGECSFVDDVMSLLATDFFVPVSISLVMLFLWFGASDPVQRVKNQYAVMCGAASLGIACGVVAIFNANVEMWPRPFEEDEGIREVANAIFYTPHDPSFPANLAAIAFGAAMGVWIYNRKASIPIFVLGALWSISRVYAGVHYPLDILGGAASGIVSAFFSYGLLKVFWPLPKIGLWLGRKVYVA